MVSETEERARADHRELLELIDSLAGSLRGLRDDVNWGDTTCAEDYYALSFVGAQVVSLATAVETFLRGDYRSGYHIVRMVLEGYFVLRLITTCELYPVHVPVKEARGDRCRSDALRRAETLIRKRYGSTVVSIRPEGKHIVAVIRGIPIHDPQGNDTGRVQPLYSVAWRDFRPVEYHLRRDSLVKKLQTKRYLTGEWAAAPKSDKKDLTKRNRSIYQNLLTFDRMLENLRLNGVLNKKTSTRVLVHYNFLSNFTHCTSDSVSLATVRYLRDLPSDAFGVVYRERACELGLLYVCHLLGMHLAHLLHYLRYWRGLSIGNERRIYRRLLAEIEREFGYFWFIFNRPHEWDRFQEANRRSNYRKGLILKPEQVSWASVRYHENPLQRLEGLHQSAQEITSGNVYIAPFSNHAHQAST